MSRKRGLDTTRVMPITNQPKQCYPNRGYRKKLLYAFTRESQRKLCTQTIYICVWSAKDLQRRTRVDLPAAVPCDAHFS
jgi:hypothetical protein